jgi:Peptidase family M28
MRVQRAIAAGAVAMLVAGCASLRSDVETLAGDAFGGRDNGTAGSALAQDYLIGRLRGFSAGFDPARGGADAYRMPFAGGTNLVGIIPGRDLADEYVVVGAHYDHLGTGHCRTADPADTICNGATDNATGVAAALAVGERLARGAGPRRSVVVALWDREEDGLLGSRAWVAAPPIPIARTVAYINFDIQGANLSPSLASTTFAVGAESGGAALRAAVDRAARPGPLHTRQLSSVFGQGRSDYINFIGAGVPTVFFSDSTGPCYHTAQDESGIVDFRKLGHQADTALRLARDLAGRDDPPAFVGGTPLVAYSDAVALQRVGERLERDLDRFTAPQQATLLGFKAEIDQIVAAGAAAFTPASGNRVIVAVLAAQELLTTGACDGFVRR